MGGYSARKTEQEHYASELQTEYDEVEKIPEKEKEEIKEIFKEYGLSDKAQNLIVDELTLDKDKWVHFMMKYESGLEAPGANRANKIALTIGSSYIVGGIIPLIPYFLTSTHLEGLTILAGITIICLFVFGYFKSKVTGQPVLRGAIKVTVIGTLAAAAACFDAKLIGG